MACFLLVLQRARLCFTQPAEAHLVSGTQLAKFPEFSLHDHGGTNKPAEAGAIRSQQDGHIPGEIHRTHAVRVVVNVGGMQACFAAVLPRPRGLRADQPHASARGVVVHFPVAGEESLDVLLREKLRATVWSIKNADVPEIFILGP